MGCCCSSVDDYNDEDTSLRDPLLIRAKSPIPDDGEVPPNLELLAAQIRDAEYTIDICSPDMCIAVQRLLESARRRDVVVRHIHHVQRHFAIVDSLTVIEGKMDIRSSRPAQLKSSDRELSGRRDEFERLWKQFNG